jgi:hypothetical protein
MEPISLMHTFTFGDLIIIVIIIVNITLFL